KPAGTVRLEVRQFHSTAVQLRNGTATVNIPAGTLGTGFNVLKAVYSGDSNYNAASGGGLVQVATATITVTPSESTIAVDQPLPVPVALGVLPGDPPLTGKVTVFCNSYQSPMTPLRDGKATIAIPAGTLVIGSNTINVRYGDGNYAGVAAYAIVEGTAPAG